jgi:putative sigma-54 modulation protein
MNLSITGRHVELTDALKAHITTSVETLDKYNLDIISVYAVISTQERHGKRGHTIEFTISLAAKNTVVIKQRDNDLYAAIDIASDRAQKALRRISDRNSDHRDSGINEAKNEAKEQLNPSDIAESREDEIVPMQLELYKPIEIAEALDNLKESNKQFEIFIDMDGKTRVLFKRNDGKFGLH